jgi:hypothetical protein
MGETDDTGANDGKIIDRHGLSPPRRTRGPANRLDPLVAAAAKDRKFIKGI